MLAGWAAGLVRADWLTTEDVNTSQRVRQERADDDCVQQHRMPAGKIHMRSMR